MPTVTTKKAIATFQQIESRIYLIRGHKVMLDTDLGWLYGVETRALIQAVKRNSERFPEDFMFQLSQEEFDLEITICDLKSERTWRPSVSTLCFHRARSCHAFECSAQPKSSDGQR